MLNLSYITYLPLVRLSFHYIIGGDSEEDRVYCDER